MVYKMKIKTKILLLVLGISFISLAVLMYAAVHTINNLGEYALNTNKTLGEKASTDSKTALEKQACDSLLRLAKDQADISNNTFLKTEAEVNTMSEFMSELYKSPKHFGSGTVLSPQKSTEGIPTLKYRKAPDVDLNSVKGELGLLANMIYALKPVLENDKNISSAYMGSESGISISYSPFVNTNSNYDPRKRDWYKNAAKAKKLIWTDTYKDAFGNGLMITCAKPCYNTNGKLIGVVAVDVSLKSMNEQIINTQIGNSGYAFLIDNKGKIVACPDMEKEKVSNINILTETTNLDLKKIINNMISKKTGIALCNFSDGDKYIAYAPLKETNWSLATVMPHKEVIKTAVMTMNKINNLSKRTETHMKQIRLNFILANVITLVFIIVIIIFLAINLSNKLTKPLQVLSHSAELVGKGDLEEHIEIKTGDEIEELANVFNTMTQNLKSYIKDLARTTAEKEKIQSELKVAKNIQASMLPRIFPPFPDKKEICIYASMEPAKEVGGDFYDFFVVNNKLYFVMADVSGKGVPAALFMVIAKTLIKNQGLQGLSPDEIFIRVNNSLCCENEESMFVTAFCGMLDLDTGELVCSNAGHNPPLIYRADGEFEWVTTKKSFVLAAMENMKYVKNDLKLNPGDMIFLYTDGVTEAMNIDGVLYSDSRLKETLNNLKGSNEIDIIKGVRVDIKEHVREAEQSDDITMLAINYKGKGDNKNDMLPQ